MNRVDQIQARHDRAKAAGAAWRNAPNLIERDSRSLDLRLAVEAQLDHIPADLEFLLRLAQNTIKCPCQGMIRHADLPDIPCGSTVGGKVCHCVPCGWRHEAEAQP